MQGGAYRPQQFGFLQGHPPVVRNRSQQASTSCCFAAGSNAFRRLSERSGCCGPVASAGFVQSAASWPQPKLTFGAARFSGDSISSSCACQKANMPAMTLFGNISRVLL